MTLYAVKPLNRPRFLRRKGIWFAEDHLLVIEKALLVERYRRFYYRDIRALAIERSPYGIIFTSALVALIAIFTAIFFLEKAPVETHMAISGTFGVILAIHLALGATCRVRIRTAASDARLPKIWRFREARRFANSLEERMKTIGIAYPPPGAEEASADGAPGGTGPAGAGDPRLALHTALSRLPASPGSVIESPEQEPPPFKPAAHLALFSVLLVDAFISAMLIDFNHVALHVAGTSLLLPLVVSLGFALAHGRGRGAFLRSVTWATFTYLAIFILVGMAYGQFLALDKPATDGNAWKIMQEISRINPDPVSAYTRIQIAATSIAALLGFFGIAAVIFEQVGGHRRKGTGR